MYFINIGGGTSVYPYVEVPFIYLRNGRVYHIQTWHVVEDYVAKCLAQVLVQVPETGVHMQSWVWLDGLR